MTKSLLDFPNITTTQETQNHAGLVAWRCAEELLILAARLPPMMQPIYCSWLKAQAQGALVECTQEEISLWLNGLHPGQAESEYRLALMEISWLEVLACDFFPFLSKETL